MAQRPGPRQLLHNPLVPAAAAEESTAKPTTASAPAAQANEHSSCSRTQQHRPQRRSHQPPPDCRQDHRAQLERARAHPTPSPLRSSSAPVLVQRVHVDHGQRVARGAAHDAAVPQQAHRVAPVKRGPARGWGGRGGGGGGQGGRVWVSGRAWNRIGMSAHGWLHTGTRWAGQGVGAAATLRGAVQCARLACDRDDCGRCTSITECSGTTTGLPAGWVRGGRAQAFQCRQRTGLMAGLPSTPRCLSACRGWARPGLCAAAAAACGLRPPHLKERLWGATGVMRVHGTLGAIMGPPAWAIGSTAAPQLSGLGPPLRARHQNLAPPLNHSVPPSSPATPLDHPHWSLNPPYYHTPPPPPPLTPPSTCRHVVPPPHHHTHTHSHKHLRTCCTRCCHWAWR